MRLFSIIGITQSGKTTTIEAIISELRRRGYSVGSVKEIHFEQFAIDNPTSNTARHRRAGSELVTARGYYETDVLYQSKLPMEQILSNYDYDYVALEGVRDLAVPTVIAAHCEEEVDQRLSEQVFAITGKLADRIDEYRGLAALSAVDPQQLQQLVDLLELLPCEWQPPQQYQIVRDGGKYPLSARQNLLLEQALADCADGEIVLVKSGKGE